MKEAINSIIKSLSLMKPYEMKKEGDLRIQKVFKYKTNVIDLLKKSF